MSTVLDQHRDVWRRKPILRRIYADYYRRIRQWVRPGRTLEIGGGTGNLKEFLPDIVSTDIQFASWLDAVADAQRLPFGEVCFTNIVMFDVLHHIERPHRFLAEVQRVLIPGGRLIVLEPGITPLSRLVYTLFHPEPIDLNADPLEDGMITLSRNPYGANQAIPTLLFGRDRLRLETLFPMLHVVSQEWLGLIAYPLSGGFRPWSLIPESAVEGLLRLEDRLGMLLGPWMAFRLLGVIERTGLGVGGAETMSAKLLDDPNNDTNIGAMQ